MIRWREILEKKEAENSAFTLTLAQGLSHGEEKYVLSNMFYEHPSFCYKNRDQSWLCSIPFLKWNVDTVEPRYNEPLHNEVLGITNDFLNPSNCQTCGKNLDITKPRYSEKILLFFWPFVVSRLHCR